MLRHLGLSFIILVAAARARSLNIRQNRFGSSCPMPPGVQ